LMSAELRVLPDWPEGDDDPRSPRGSRRVVGDVIVEVSPAGDIVKQWKMLDVLDPYRLCYGSCSDIWQSRGFPDSSDWSHGNAVTYDDSDDSILVSLRHQDCIIKLDRASGELKWILGDHGNWRRPWSSKLLKPIGPLQWQYHQHDCSVTPSGTVLCFDNGNFRATPFREKMAADRSYSRAVEYAVDETEMTVSQVWSYGERPDERLYACYQGGAYRLPKSGNTVINYGGICTINGVPTHNVEGSCQARLVEVTPENEIVFDLWIGSTGSGNSAPLCSFRSEFVPE
jgi:arylsulfate sulfotransferase